MSLLDNLNTFEELKKEAAKVPFLEKELSDAQDKISQLESELEDQKREAEKALSKKEDELADCQKEINKLEEKIKEMEKEMNENPPSSQVKEYIAELVDEVKFLRNELDEYRHGNGAGRM